MKPSEHRHLDDLEDRGEVVREVVENGNGDPFVIHIKRTIALDEFDADPETVVAAVRAECDHHVDDEDWHFHRDVDCYEVEAECRRCGALLTHYVEASDMEVRR